MIAKNIKYLRKRKKWTQQDLADKMDLPRTTLGDYERGKTEPSIPMLVQLAQAFEVDIDSLVTQPLFEIKSERTDVSHIADLKNGESESQFMSPKGKGDRKWQSEDGRNDSVHGINRGQYNKAGGLIGEDLEGKISNESLARSSDYFSVNHLSYGTVELVESKAEAGYLESMSDPEFVKDLPKIHIPNLPKNHYRGFEINGDSMLPLESGTLIISTFVPTLSAVKQDKTYIIITKREGLVYKRLAINPGKDYFTAYSDNSLYPPYKIYYEDIDEIWQYYAHIGFSDHHGSNYDISIEQRLSKMESMVQKIHDKVVKVKD